MQRYLSLLCGLAFASTPLALSGAPLDIKGVQMDQPWDPDAIKGAFMVTDMAEFFTCGDTAGLMYCKGMTRLVDCDGDAFINSTVNATPTVEFIGVTFSPDCFDGLIPSLLKKYGRPSKVTSAVLQNMYGVKVIDRRLIWNKDGRHVEARKYEDMTSSQLTLMTDAPSQKEGSL